MVAVAPQKKNLLNQHLILHMLPAMLQRKFVNDLEGIINVRPPTRTLVEI